MKKIILAISILACIRAEAQISVTKAIVPQYIQGVTSTNNNRTNLWFWAEIAGLTPNATYNFYTSIDTLNSSTTANGVGNPILINMASRSVRRSSNPSLSNAAGHDSLVADTSGKFSGWFGIEPTSNVRFTPGNTIFPKIILNNGAGGTSTATRLMLTGYTIKVINYGTTAGSSVQGSAVYDSIPVAAKSFVCLYNDTAINTQTDRPISIAIVENDSLDLTQLSSSPTFYKTQVDGKNHYWGTIVPNDLTNGINRVVALDFSTAQVIAPIYTTKLNDGVWCGVATKNLANSTTALRLKTSLLSPLVTLTANKDTICQKSTVTLTAHGAQTYTWSEGSGTLSSQILSPMATIIYHVTGTDNLGCSNKDSITIVVNSLPTVSLTLPEDTLCSWSTPITLTGGLPTGGQYTLGASIIAQFDPSTASNGSNTIIYFYTDTNNCTNADTSSIYVDICTNLKQVSSLKNTIVYPNPTTGRITINLNEVDKNAFVEIYTITGQLIVKEKMQNAIHTLDLSNKLDGIYILRIVNTEGIINQSKIVLQK